MMGHLNSLNKNFPKIQMHGGLPRGGMLKLRFDWYIKLSLREISYVLHVHALMTRKSCAVGMRNAILRHYLNTYLLTWGPKFRRSASSS